MAYLQRSSANGAQAQARPRHARNPGRNSHTSPESSPTTTVSTTTNGDSSVNSSTLVIRSRQYDHGSSSGSSWNSDHLTTSSLSPTLHLLHAHIRAMHPPQPVLDAVTAASEARDRLTIQVYYAVPQYFDADRAGDLEYTRRIRPLKNAQLPEAAGLLSAASKYSTMRAALALLNNERSATQTINTWLSSSIANQAASAESGRILRDLQITLFKIQEAGSILYKAMAPQQNGTQA